MENPSVHEAVWYNCSVSAAVERGAAKCSGFKQQPFYCLSQVPRVKNLGSVSGYRVVAETVAGAPGLRAGLICAPSCLICLCCLSVCLSLLPFGFLRARRPQGGRIPAGQSCTAASVPWLCTIDQPQSSAQMRGEGPEERGQRPHLPVRRGSRMDRCALKLS